MKLSPSKILNVKSFKKEPRLLLIVSRFNETVCQGLKEGAVKFLKELGFKNEPDIIRVPGAFEMPLAALKLNSKKKYDGIICLGAVIRGQTAHFEYICQAVSYGLMKVNLKTGIPVGFGVLTTNDEEQAIARSLDNEHNKGREATQAVLEMIGLLGGGDNG